MHPILPPNTSTTLSHGRCRDCGLQEIKIPDINGHSRDGVGGLWHGALCPACNKAWQRNHYRTKATEVNATKRARRAAGETVK